MFLEGSGEDGMFVELVLIEENRERWKGSEGLGMFM